MRLVFLSTVFCVMTMLLAAQSQKVVTVFQPEIQFTLTPPSGWNSDDVAAKDMRLLAALHPDEYKWTNAPTVMYVNLTFKRDSNQTLDQIIELDGRAFQKKAAGIKIAREAQLSTFPQGKTVELVSYRGGEFDNYEYVAYIDEGMHIVMVVLGARSEEQMNWYLPAYKKFVQSYYNLMAD